MKFYLAIIVGVITYAIIGLLGLYLLKVCWTEYNIASATKSYSITMLAARLSVAMLASIAAGFMLSKIAYYNKSTQIASVIIFLGASYIHIFRVWPDYPVWYHLAYLLPIIPTILFTYHVLLKRNRLKDVNKMISETGE